MHTGHWYVLGWPRAVAAATATAVCWGFPVGPFSISNIDDGLENFHRHVQAWLLATMHRLRGNELQQHYYAPPSLGRVGIMHCRYVYIMYSCIENVDISQRVNIRVKVGR